jgi:hypothetical protein
MDWDWYLFPQETFFQNENACPFAVDMHTPILWLDEIEGLKYSSPLGNPLDGYITPPKWKRGPNVLLKGVVRIDEGTEVSPFVVIEDSVIGRNVKIGSFVRIKGSIIFDEAKISSGSEVEDSVVGYKTRISSGVITRNRLHTQGIINVTNGKERYSTGREKFGGIFGDESRITRSTPPGCLVGHHSLVECELGSGNRYIPPETCAFYRPPIELRHIEPVRLERYDRRGKI